MSYGNTSSAMRISSAMALIIASSCSYDYGKFDTKGNPANGGQPATSATAIGGDANATFGGSPSGVTSGGNTSDSPLSPNAGTTNLVSGGTPSSTGGLAATSGEAPIGGTSAATAGGRSGSTSESNALPLGGDRSSTSSGGSLASSTSGGASTTSSALGGGAGDNTVGSSPAGGNEAAGSVGTDCPAPKVVCYGVCTDLEFDSRNCGVCGRACPSGFICAANACVCSTASACGVGNNVKCFYQQCSCDGLLCGAGLVCSKKGECVNP